MIEKKKDSGSACIWTYRTWEIRLFLYLQFPYALFYVWANFYNFPPESAVFPRIVSRRFRASHYPAYLFGSLAYPTNSNHRIDFHMIKDH